jgi:MFS family permease
MYDTFMHRNIRLIKWFNFCTDFKLYTAVSILYFAQVTGSFTLAMSVFSIIMVSSALFEVPTGIFSDRIGRKKTMTLGAVAAVCSVLFYAIGGSFGVLVIGALFEGLSRSFYSGNNDALVHDILNLDGKEAEYGAVIGKVSVMGQVALAIAAVLGSVIASWSFSWVMWLSIIPQMMCVALSLFLADIPRLEQQSANVYSHFIDAVRLFLKNPKLRLLSLSDMLNFAFSESTFHFTAAFYQTVWPVWSLGLAKGLSYVGAAVGFHYSGAFIKRFNSFKLLIVGYIVRRVVTLAGVFFPTVFSPLLMSTSSVPWAITATAQNALLQREFDPTKRATMASLNSFGGSLLFGIFSISIGVMADVVSARVAIIAIQMLSLVVLIFQWKLFSHSKIGIREQSSAT